MNRLRQFLYYAVVFPISLYSNAWLAWPDFRLIRLFHITMILRLGSLFIIVLALVVNITKIFDSQDGPHFYSYGVILVGLFGGGILTFLLARKVWWSGCEMVYRSMLIKNGNDLDDFKYIENENFRLMGSEFLWKCALENFTKSTGTTLWDIRAHARGVAQPIGFLMAFNLYILILFSDTIFRSVHLSFGLAFSIGIVFVLLVGSLLSEIIAWYIFKQMKN